MFAIRVTYLPKKSWPTQAEIFDALQAAKEVFERKGLSPYVALEAQYKGLEKYPMIRSIWKEAEKAMNSKIDCHAELILDCYAKSINKDELNVCQQEVINPEDSEKAAKDARQLVRDMIRNVAYQEDNSKDEAELNVALDKAINAAKVHAITVGVAEGIKALSELNTKPDLWLDKEEASAFIKAYNKTHTN